MKITEIHFDSIDSTNSYARREYASFPKNTITCVTADFQTSGRGRMERKWISPKGVNLYATFCFHLKASVSDLSSLAIVAAHSVATLLENLGLHPQIKWPNDVKLDGKKVSGILCETIFENDDVQILLGIGLNVNMDKPDLEQINQPATSLKMETGRTWNRKNLLIDLQHRIASNLELFKKEGFQPFHAKVESLLAHRGEQVRCFDGKTEWEGVCHSLGKDGRLLLRLSDGSFHEVLSGDML